jgi:Rieske Fe-S protein
MLVLRLRFYAAVLPWVVLVPFVPWIVPMILQADEPAPLPVAKSPADAQPPQVPNEAQVMRVKLQRSQVLLQALTMEDFKTLQENAESLVRISRATEFLRAYKTEEYEFQARVFQKAAEALAAKAKEKNIDGAMLAYMDITISCVACHNHFRGRKRD